MTDITLTLSPRALTALAEISRRHIRSAGVIVTTIHRAEAPDIFDALVERLSEEDAIIRASELGLPECGPIATTPPVAAPDPTPEPRERQSLVPEWVAAGQDAYRDGVARDALTGGRRQLPHMQAGWDHAKAEAEHALAAANATMEEPAGEMDQFAGDVAAGERLLVEVVKPAPANDEVLF
jgi:hypothetical protein